MSQTKILKKDLSLKNANLDTQKSGRNLSISEGVHMKALFLLFLSLVFTCSAFAQSTLVLQEKCAEGAKKFYTESGRNEVGQQSFNGHHYNKKLDICFVEIGYSYGKEEVKEWKEAFPESRPLMLPSWEVRLYDVFGDSTLTVFPSPFARYYRVQGKVIECYVGNKKCKSIEEYDALIKSYMED